MLRGGVGGRSGPWPSDSREISVAHTQGKKKSSKATGSGGGRASAHHLEPQPQSRSFCTVRVHSNTHRHLSGYVMKCAAGKGGERRLEFGVLGLMTVSDVYFGPVPPICSLFSPEL